MFFPAFFHVSFAFIEKSTAGKKLLLIDTISTLFIILMTSSIVNGSPREENRDVINLIGDFIAKLNEPAKVTAFICWSRDETLLFSKTLSFNNIPWKIGGNYIDVNGFSPPEHQFFLMDADCDHSKHVLGKANGLKLFQRPFKWIIWGRNDESDFENYDFRLDSRIFFIEKVAGIYGIKLWYKLTEGGVLKNDLATWLPSRKFLTFDRFSFYKNRSNLMGKNLTAAFVITDIDTYQHLEDYRHTHIDALSKHNWHLMKVLSSILNAKFVNIFENTWGYREKNSTSFSGMIGDLQTNKADIGGGGAFITEERLDVVDYVSPCVRVSLKFIFRAPPLTSVSNLFTLPFSSSVWYACFALVPIILIIIYVIVKWESKDAVFQKEAKDNNVAPLRAACSDVLVMELGAVTQQGAESEPKSNAGRIATIFLFIAFMFLFNSYAANIVAILQSTTDSIKSLEDLLNSRMECGVEDIPYGHQFFEKAQDPIRKAIYEQKVAPKGQKPNFLNIYEGVRKVQQGFFAFHVDVLTGYTVIKNLFREYEKCTLKELIYIRHTEPWIPIKKNSPYKELIAVGLIRIIETGVQGRHTHRIYTKKPVCNSGASNFMSVGIMDIYAAFLVFGIGAVVAVVVFFFEISVCPKFGCTFEN
ncbi:ionotropic receptor 75a-like [Diorhabda sublineata]|uniref:ionotropic receptor 75a-like n=1 Tax=Diorhabda sublineata TaxID=1163346 RepID=UPI0024E15F30|nr:ionotropic receptor 75a-like [Diorhabda sublineata]